MAIESSSDAAQLKNQHLLKKYEIRHMHVVHCGHDFSARGRNFEKLISSLAALEKLIRIR
jgi:hypothetical protein